MSNRIPAERNSLRYPGNPYPDRDIATIGDNGGVRFLFDLGFGYCYPGGPLVGRAAPGNPVNGAPVYNMTRQGEGAGNGSVIIAPTANGGVSSAITYAGGGLDMSAALHALANSEENGVIGPAGVLADIWNPAPAGAHAPGQSQHYLWVGYYKLPTAAEWASTAVTDSIRGVFSASNSKDGYPAVADLLQVAMRPDAEKRIDMRRQTAIGALEATAIVQPSAADYGKLVQLAAYRNASGTRFRLKSAAGVVLSALGTAGPNTADFSACRPVWGHPAPWYHGTDGYAGLRVYRGWIENLARSGRDPVSVLDADWDDVVRRGQFS